MTTSSFDLLEARRRLGLSQAQLAHALNVTMRTLQNWEAGKGMSHMAKKMGDLRDLLSRMDDYVIASQQKEWLCSSLEVFGGRTPQQLIAEGRMRDIVIEFDKTPIRTSDELLSRVRRGVPYSTVTVVAMRDGQRIEIPVKLGKR